VAGVFRVERSLRFTLIISGDVAQLGASKNFRRRLRGEAISRWILRALGKLMCRGENMPVMNYNKLWKLLIDKRMNRNDLRQAAKVSTTVIAKMGKGENVTTDVLIKICNVLNCDVADIMEIDKTSGDSANAIVEG
jgi:DNA-binding Xre family transcriptional regulator